MRLGIDDESTNRRRPIPEARDRAQSRALVWIASGLLALAAAVPPVATLKLGLPLWPLGLPIVVSVIFGLVVWGLRAATPAGVAVGALICFLLTQSPQVWTGFSTYPVEQSALPALIAVFLISFAATKYGGKKKEASGLAETRRGRQASQIVANLSVAALFAAAGRYEGCIAALAEAAADTASSEIGQASGDPVRLLTTWKSVPAGTDGGISVRGTIAGVLAAGIVVVLGGVRHALWPHGAVTLLSACAGLVFDSLLGATVERRGWIGNDLVNFSSTLFAALLATMLS
jgi:uncharacterized protein (TIGR00297 family)